MKEKLIIKNFGPIKDVELELGRFNILIGEQATGKSTVAKLLAVCRYFSYIVNYETDEWLEHNFIRGLNNWGLNEFLKESTEIFYQNLDYKFTCKARIEKELEPDYGEKKWITVETNIQPLSRRFELLIEELKTIRTRLVTENLGDLSIPTSFFQNDVASVMDNPFYFPTERGLQSIFSLGKGTIPNINDWLFNQFANLDKIAKNYKNDTEIEPLNVVYKNVAGQGYVKKKNELEFYSLANGASGYQSAIPVVLVTKFYSELRRKNKTFIIEEPELNLFPSAQYKLIKYLVEECVNNNNSVFLTTHSPYTLTAVNNLLYAYKVGEKNELDVNPVIDKKYWLDPEVVSAYKLLADGTCENIFDKNEEIIEAEKIDSISRELNGQFDKIQDIELGINK